MTEMDDETKILFTDTNGFLQVRDLKDIPWKALFPHVNAVDVMVAPRVIEELDKHKTSTNQRLRDRSRLALQIIEKASREPDLALELRDGPVRVRIVISTAPRFDWTMHSNLDPAKPDDQLVAEALSFGNGAAIFSHDAGPEFVHASRGSRLMSLMSNGCSPSNRRMISERSPNLSATSNRH